MSDLPSIEAFAPGVAKRLTERRHRRQELIDRLEEGRIFVGSGGIGLSVRFRQKDDSERV